ncbi:DNA-binding transcriptional LysR family regulator [Amycolatopsis sulphurea]|uniref:DNA-binding transcriptional LysR family regulator n=1 Tax=Amycolatopsis sulphurea TaxID=76022 RepID=A0A2A9G2X8_9PSEU|nr:LysR family transcriptional regulator [Amycolatopsis sulphurea]PFG57160.1 DNA-binding transcriptional LysR family regulator [Amycolatopsis sulphurea]
MDIELRQLRILVAVADAGSVPAAAAVLGITPATLRQRIHRLERAVGSVLLTDGTAGNLFTETGERLLEHAAVAVPQFDRMLAAAQASAEAASDLIRIGAVATPVLPRLVREVHVRKPGADLSVRVAEPGTELIEALLRDELDLVVLRQNGSGDAVIPGTFTSAPVATEPLVVGIPPGHALGVTDTLTPSMLSGHRCVLLDQTVQPMTRTVLAAFSDAGADPRFCYADSEWAALSLGHGAGILTVTTLPTAPVRGTAYRPLRCPATISTLVLAWSPEGPLAGCVPSVREATAQAHAAHLSALVS